MHGGDCYRNEVNMDFSINVNPLGIPEEIADAMQQSLTQAMVYPDPQCQALRQAIGRVYQKDAACIVCGNGASDLLLAFARAFMPKKALLPVPGFSGYAYALKSIGCHVALFDTKEDEDFALSEAFLDRIRSEAPDLVILTNPGNPSGHMLSQEFLTKVAGLCRHMKIRLLIDECFIELTGEGKDNSFLKASSGTKNIFILQALTKSMAIPGIRLGYLFCPKEQDAKKVQEQVSEWNVSVIAQRAGIAGMQVLADGTYLSQTRQLLERERAYLTQSLQEIGAKVYPGTANFLLFYEDSIDWYAALLKQKILIRDCSDYAGLSKGFYRIAIRRREENQVPGGDHAGSQKGRESQMEIEIVKPQEIEKRSFEIIEEELKERGIVLPEKEVPITKRVIHTSADFSYAETMTYSPGAIEQALELIKGGAHIVTDTNMAKAGINKKTLARLGGQVHCFMADEAVAKEAKERGVTRAVVSMETAARLPGPVIFAIGNAPTALIELHEMIEQGAYVPAFIIGVPVGFVNVEAAKELFLDGDVPYIINRGRKGGSNIAAAICNALLYLASNNIRD